MPVKTPEISEKRWTHALDKAWSIFMTNKKGLIKLTALLSAFLIMLAIVVISLQYKQVEYIFAGEAVSATVTSANGKGNNQRVKVSYIDDDGTEVIADANLKKEAEVGDKVNVIASNRKPNVVYQVPSRHMILMFDIVFLFLEFLGWLAVVYFLKKLKKYKKLAKKGKKATAVIKSVKNTSGALEADIEFVDDGGTKRSTVYYPISDIPEAGEQLDIVYYVKRTGKIVFMVPSEE